MDRQLLTALAATVALALMCGLLMKDVLIV